MKPGNERTVLRHGETESWDVAGADLRAQGQPQPPPLQVLLTDAITFLLELSGASVGGMCTPLQWKDSWGNHCTGSGSGDRTQPYPGSPLKNPQMLK